MASGHDDDDDPFVVYVHGSERAKGSENRGWRGCTDLAKTTYIQASCLVNRLKTKRVNQIYSWRNIEEILLELKFKFEK